MRDPGYRHPGEVACVVGPVGVQRGRSADTAFKHREGGVPFGVAIGLGQFDINHQPVTVLGQHMAQVAEPGRLLLALAVGAAPRDRSSTRACRGGGVRP